MSSLGKTIIVLGLVMIVTGAALWAVGQVPGFGRLPGDIYVKRGNLTFYFPLGTCILVSLILSLLLMLLRR